MVSVWGSLGSDHINALMPELLRIAEERHSFDLIHSAGKRGYPKLLAAAGERDALKRKGLDVREYIYDMPTVMAAADLVLCRSGASTLAELAALGKPAILVPSPNVTGHQQEKNAALVESLGGAKVLLEGGFDAMGLYEAAEALLEDKDGLETCPRLCAAAGTQPRPSKSASWSWIF